MISESEIDKAKNLYRRELEERRISKPEIC